MICQLCKDNGWFSRVQIGEQTSTLMGGSERYWDEHGDLHIHDPNFATVRYWCSMGHTWTERAKARYCPTCDGDEQ